jgi:hypothetical protein
MIRPRLQQERAKTPSHELRWNRSRFDAEAVKTALEKEKFPNVELLSAPAEGPKKE